jgi:hypothetical protein
VRLFNRIAAAAAVLAAQVKASHKETFYAASEDISIALPEPRGERGLDIRYKPVPAFPERRSYRAAAREKSRRRNVSKR